MAHQYSNFTSAFNAYKNRWNYARAHYLSGWNYQSEAASYWLGGNDHLAINSLINCAYDILSCFQDLADFWASSTDQSDFMESIYWAAQGGAPPSITMDDILTAMLQATFDQLREFIGINDAYRSAMWDEWYNYEYFAALARGFKELVP